MGEYALWGRGREDCEFGISMCKLVYLGWINNKVLMHSRRNYIQYPVINLCNGKRLWKRMYVCITEGLPRNLPAKAGGLRDPGSIPESGRFPGGGHGDPLQYSCLENPMDRRAWRATVHGVTKSQTRPQGCGMHTCMTESLCCTAEITTL